MRNKVEHDGTVGYMVKDAVAEPKELEKLKETEQSDGREQENSAGSRG